MVKAICKGRLTFPILTSQFNIRIISGFDSLFNSEIPFVHKVDKRFHLQMADMVP